jgi:hypothetical protein
MADGALRSDVLRALDEASVAAEPMADAAWYRVSRDDLTIAVRMRDTVSRTVTDLLHRTFSISKSKFFPTQLRVVQKAAGAERD